MTPTSAESASDPGFGWSEQLPLGWLFAAFLVVAYSIYAPALGGEFVSDDSHYVAQNAYVHELSPDNLIAILSPVGPVPLAMENYAPVNILLHALQWQVFGPDVRGHHLVNILLHATASFLLVVLFRRSGVGGSAAMLGGAFFLVHPANVEAVAWISQLKSSSALVLALGAVLVHPRRPGLGALLFALSLLAKPMAAVAIFFVVVLGWLRTPPDPGAEPASAERTAGGGWAWGWIGVWAVALLLFALAEISAFAHTAGQHQATYEGFFVRGLSTIANAGRYLAMATTSLGTSTFHDPPATTSVLSPWLLGSVVASALIVWRMVVVLRARREEAAYWVWAAVSFGPISGVLSLPYPMAVRYLYFVLPGLIGAFLLAASEWSARTPLALGTVSRRQLGLVVQVTALILIVAFAFRSHARSQVWLSAETVTADSARQYPNGRSSLLHQGLIAARQGRATESVAFLRAAHDRGYNELDALLTPNFSRIHDAPSFVALKREWAQEWVELYSGTDRPHQPQLMMLSQAYITLGDLVTARRTIHRAIYAGGPMTDYLHAALAELDRVEARLDAGAARERR